MDLVQALRYTGARAIFHQPPRLAFVGAGGKTAALFQLARELLRERYPSVWVTATTHLGVSQASLADHHLRIDNKSGFPDAIPGGVTLFTSPGEVDGRLAGLGDELLERLHVLAEAQQVPLLIEADGARLRPLKAPAEHEPVIPGFVDGVVVVAGLSGLGKLLSAQWVHRPERFGKLAGLEPGEAITVEALRKVLVHAQGGLKGIPAGARRVLLLNLADTEALRNEGMRLAEMCLRGDLTPNPSPGGRGGRDGFTPGYGCAIVASLNPLSPESSFARPVCSVHEPMAIVLLAAGGSRRLGRPKQLLDWHGKPLVRHAAELALSAGAQRVRIVVGAYQEQVRQMLQGLSLEIVENPDWGEGQASSVRSGIQGLPEEIGAALFLLVDQPQVPVSLLRGLLDLHAQGLPALTAPLCQGRRANPVVFDRVTFPDLLELQGDVGGRALFTSPKGYEAAWLPWEDERLLWDLDTEEDYMRLLSI